MKGTRPPRIWLLMIPILIAILCVILKKIFQFGGINIVSWLYFVIWVAGTISSIVGFLEVYNTPKDDEY